MVALRPLVDGVEHPGGEQREWYASRTSSCLAEAGDPPGVRPVLVGLGGLASPEFDDLHQPLNEGRARFRHGGHVNSDAIHEWLWSPLRAMCGVG